MITNDRLIWNVTGQTHQLRVFRGRPTGTPTYQVVREYMTDDSTPEFSGNATIDSYTQSLTAAAGPNQADPNKITPASTAGLIAGQRYLLHEASTGMQEWVTPTEIESSYLRVRNGLRNNYTTAATLDSTYLSFTVDSTFITSKVKVNVQPDPNPGYRVRWSYTVGSTTEYAYTFFTVVRAKMPHNVDVGDVTPRAHGLVEAMPAEFIGEQLRPVIDSAYQVVQADLAACDVNPDAFRDTQVIDELTIRATLMLLAQGGWKPLGYQTIAEYYKVVSDDYHRFLEKRIQVVLKPRISFGIAGEAELVFAEPGWSK